MNGGSVSVGNEDHLFSETLKWKQFKYLSAGVVWRA